MNPYSLFPGLGGFMGSPSGSVSSPVSPPVTPPAGVTVNASLAVLLLTTYAATILTPIEVNAAHQSMTLTTYPATVASAVDVQATTQAMTLATYQATVTVAEAVWTAPVGIPAPPFGITEVSPAFPSPWTTDQTGFYYVQSGGTNVGNGYPGNPRATIPSPLPAGAVVQLVGTYTQKHEAGNSITVNGTISSPVFIRGTSNAVRPIIKEKVEVTGSYYIIEYVNAQWDNASVNGKLNFSGDHGCVRHGNFGGDLDTGIGGVNPGGAYMVVYDNHLHDFGDVNAGFDQDNHGIVAVNGDNNIWVVDNIINGCSGDGMQINGNLATRYIYFGRNTCYGNKQAGMWAKTCQDVIVSQNTIYNHRPSGSSDGQGLGCQYGPDYLWFILNRVYDCESGIRSGGDSGFGVAQPNRWFIGNLIYNITNTGANDSGDPHASGAIVLRGGYANYVINNTLWNYQAGIMSPAGGFLQLENNILGGRNVALGRDIYVSVGTTATGSTVKNSIVYGSPSRITWGSGSGGTVYTLAGFQSTFSKGQDCVDADPLFVNSGTNDYHLQTGSPGVNTGLAHAAYAAFQSRYGIDIAKDMELITRPASGTWDMGVYER